MALIRVLRVGKGGADWADEAVADYTRRVRRWGGIEDQVVRTEPFRGDPGAVREAEGARLLAAIGPRDRLVVLDERGEDLDTAAFTALIEQSRGDGSRLVFAIGGAYGHGAAVRERGRPVRLSAMVLNHEVARVVLYEQIYRALAAIHHVPYAH
jgi:23S rRNA (pseudouridine1915-N3)-methyltransferase